MRQHSTPKAWIDTCIDKLQRNKQHGSWLLCNSETQLKHIKPDKLQRNKQHGVYNEMSTTADIQAGDVTLSCHVITLSLSCFDNLVNKDMREQNNNTRFPSKTKLTFRSEVSRRVCLKNFIGVLVERRSGTVTLLISCAMFTDNVNPSTLYIHMSKNSGHVFDSPSGLWLSYPRIGIGLATGSITGTRYTRHTGRLSPVRCSGASNSTSPCIRLNYRFYEFPLADVCSLVKISYYYILHRGNDLHMRVGDPPRISIGSNITLIKSSLVIDNVYRPYFKIHDKLQS
ncbi:hypothetical protein J6590_015094 [Homalodisca vitripennis]|nr:hypothetical protein J6590_015094 [Homalodisca vitripennis]